MKSTYALLALLAAALLAGPAAAGDIKIGKQKAKNCATCHGLDGLAKMPQVPNIAGESTLYLETQLKAFRSGERRHEIMSIIASGLSDEDIANVSAWYAAIELSVKLPE